MKVEDTQDIQKSMSQLFRFLVRALGVLLIGAGVFLGYQSYQKAVDILDNPNKLVPWLELDKSIFPPDTEAKKQPVTTAPQKNEPVVVSQEEFLYKIFAEMRSYIIIFLSFLYLWVLAKISLGIIKAGTGLLLAKDKEE
jgi:hypothetical protein